MQLLKIELNNFRNFKKQKFDIDPRLTIIIGPNAAGKTNLLEAIYFISRGVGFREAKEEELVNIKNDHASVLAEFKNEDAKSDLQIFLKREGNLISKKYTVNRTKRKSWQFREESTPAILFSPEQIRLIDGPPDERREYFNRLLSLYDKEYQKRLVNYENALRRRNKILEIHHSHEALVEELEFWDDYLVTQGNYLSQKRQSYVDFLNDNPTIDSREFLISYEKNEISKKRLNEFLEKEKRYRKTLIGPQKDDFVVFQKEKKEKKNLHIFGSRSEQRLSVFWLKLNEIKYEEKHNLKPILLLDDIFSELDVKNRELVLRLVKSYQTVMTTTEKEVIDLVKGEKKIIKL